MSHVHAHYLYKWRVINMVLSRCQALKNIKTFSPLTTIRGTGYCYPIFHTSKLKSRIWVHCWKLAPQTEPSHHAVLSVRVPNTGRVTLKFIDDVWRPFEKKEDAINNYAVSRLKPEHTVTLSLCGLETNSGTKLLVFKSWFCYNETLGFYLLSLCCSVLNCKMVW